jgi:hypothetical protein
MYVLGYFYLKNEHNGKQRYNKSRLVCKKSLKIPKV